MLGLSIHVFPLLTWENLCSITCGRCDHGRNLALLVCLENKGLFLWLCSGCWLWPRLPTGAPRQNQCVACVAHYSFCNFLTLIFTIVFTLCLLYNQLSYETCSIYSTFHNSQFCLKFNVYYSVALAMSALPMRLVLQDTPPRNFHSSLFLLSMNLGLFSHSFSLTTCDTQQSLTGSSIIQQISHTWSFLSCPAVSHDMYCSMFFC